MSYPSCYPSCICPICWEKRSRYGFARNARMLVHNININVLLYLLLLLLLQCPILVANVFMLFYLVQCPILLLIAYTVCPILIAAPTHPSTNIYIYHYTFRLWALFLNQKSPGTSTIKSYSRLGKADNRSVTPHTQTTVLRDPNPARSHTHTGSLSPTLCICSLPSHPDRACSRSDDRKPTSSSSPA